MVDLPTTINDIVVLSGLVNIIDKPTHFDKHTGINPYGSLLLFLRIYSWSVFSITESITCIESVIKIGSNSEILPVCLSKCVGLSII
jgi:hypothetical protein